MLYVRKYNISELTIKNILHPVQILKILQEWNSVNCFFVFFVFFKVISVTFSFPCFLPLHKGSMPYFFWTGLVCCITNFDLFYLGVFLLLWIFPWHCFHNLILLIKVSILLNLSLPLFHKSCYILVNKKYIYCSNYYRTEKLRNKLKI